MTVNDLWQSITESNRFEMLGIIADFEEDCGRVDGWPEFLRWCAMAERWPDYLAEYHGMTAYRFRFATREDRGRILRAIQGRRVAPFDFSECCMIHAPFIKRVSDGKKWSGWACYKQTISGCFERLFVEWNQLSDFERGSCLVVAKAEKSNLVAEVE